MTNNIDHDRLFKELISTFFVEFIELFFPQVMDYLDRDSITFLDKEVFTDVTEGERHESDLVAQVKFRGKESFFVFSLWRRNCPNLKSVMFRRKVEYNGRLV
ncbi:hypothetical protein MiTe_00354 [Microcystis aeruginosa NIES-2520]|jgi:hypothetical protein|uniref:Transposase (putative) YhgA-like domain-containing protein n=1 Tax=Microcystis aeruginosa NIES-2520 TaxID=2303982 RepID=A0A5A5REN8_MICAE|nr:hypothetical protein MiTe_00354 [Microcystis aeruginosa NIES-2520]